MWDDLDVAMWDDLDTEIADHLGALDQSVAPPPYELRDAMHADWTLRRLGAVETRLDQVERLRRAEIERIEAWAQAERSRLEREQAWYEGLLERWHAERLAEDPKAKTIRLPHGTLSARKAPPRWEFDADAFLAWARSHAPELVRVREEIDVAAAKRTLMLDEPAPGEVVAPTYAGRTIPGVQVMGLPRHFLARPS